MLPFYETTVYMYIDSTPFNSSICMKKSWNWFEPREIILYCKMLQRISPTKTAIYTLLKIASIHSIYLGNYPYQYQWKYSTRKRKNNT